jgi:hypothetical protein
LGIFDPTVGMYRKTSGPRGNGPIPWGTSPRATNAAIRGLRASKVVGSAARSALMLPGASFGLGCYGLSRHPSRPRGVACGLAALALGLVSEWSASPFLVDDGLAYFLAHVHHLRVITLIMIAAGGVVAFLLGQDHYLPAGKAAGPGV